MFSNVKTKTNSSFGVKVSKKASIHFYCLFDESRFSDICTIMELKELNRLYKHVKNVRSSQPCISMNFCNEFNKSTISSTWVSLTLKQFTALWKNLCNLELLWFLNCEESIKQMKEHWNIWVFNRFLDLNVALLHLNWLLYVHCYFALLVDTDWIEKITQLMLRKEDGFWHS